MASARLVSRAVRSSSAAATGSSRRAFSNTTTVRGGGGETHYNPPGGLLFGHKPGEYKKQGWENYMIYGYGGVLLFGAIGYAFKPDTSIQTWALEEARRRLEAEGILKDPETK